jgi:hypothetical protein
MFRFIVALSAVICAVPALAQERQWTLDAVGEDAFLAFGVPNTDDVGVSFWCKIGKKDLSLFTPLPPTGSHPKLNLSVGSQTFPLKVRVNTNEGSKTIEAVLQPQAKMLDALKTAESFEVTLGKHKVTYPLAEADFEGLLKLCAGQTSPAED